MEYVEEYVDGAHLEVAADSDGPAGESAETQAMSLAGAGHTNGGAHLMNERHDANGGAHLIVHTKLEVDQAGLEVFEVEFAEECSGGEQVALEEKCLVTELESTNGEPGHVVKDPE